MFDLAIQSWRTALGALQRMPRLAVSALVLLAALDVIGAIFVALMPVAPLAGSTINDLGITGRPEIGGGPATAHQLLMQGLVKLGNCVLGAFVAAPLAVGVHRYVLVDEVRDGFAVPTTRREVRFALWSFCLPLVVVLALVVASLFLVAVLSGLLAGTADRLSPYLIAFVAMVLGAVVLLRLAMAFPAVALDRPAPARESRALTYNHTWRILLTYVMAMLPFAAIFWALRVLVFVSSGGDTTTALTAIGIVLLVPKALAGVLSIALSAAVASLFYRQYAWGEGRSPQAIDAPA